MYVTNIHTYDAALRLVEIMKAEAPELYKAFVSYDATQASQRPGGKPQWTPFAAQWGVDSGLYRTLVERVARECSLDKNMADQLPSIAASIAKGEEVGLHTANGWIVATGDGSA